MKMGPWFWVIITFKRSIKSEMHNWQKFYSWHNLVKTRFDLVVKLQIMIDKADVVEVSLIAFMALGKIFFFSSATEPCVWRANTYSETVGLFTNEWITFRKPFLITIHFPIDFVIWAKCVYKHWYNKILGPWDCTILFVISIFFM